MNEDHPVLAKGMTVVNSVRVAGRIRRRTENKTSMFRVLFAI